MTGGERAARPVLLVACWDMHGGIGWADGDPWIGEAKLLAMMHPEEGSVLLAAPAGRKIPLAGWSVVIGLAGLASCGGDAGVSTSPTIRDSAGVRVVESSGARLAEWKIDREPELQIGAVDGDEAYLFDGIKRGVSTQ